MRRYNTAAASNQEKTLKHYAHGAPGGGVGQGVLADAGGGRCGGVQEELGVL